MGTSKEIDAERKRHDDHCRSVVGGPTRIDLVSVKPFASVTEVDWRFVLECLELGYIVRDNLRVELDRSEAAQAQSAGLIDELISLRDRYKPTAEQFPVGVLPGP